MLNHSRSDNPQVYNGLHYEELVTENLFLQSRLAAVSNNPTAPQNTFKPDFTVHEHVKKLFNATECNVLSDHIAGETYIKFPTRALSDVLINFAGEETAWNHFAIHVPTFREEHQQFWESNLSDAQRPWYDAGWLSVYFSLLSVCDYCQICRFDSHITYKAVLCFKGTTAMTQVAELDGQKAADYLRHWYNAAMFYLYKIDFVRVPNIRAVQAIDILGDVFVTVGEPQCFSTLWPVAIRIAQSLGIHDEKRLAGKSHLDAEMSRRLWWNLVICDWFGRALICRRSCSLLLTLNRLPVPFRTPCIHPDDFTVNLPSFEDDDELMGKTFPDRDAGYPRPVYWLIIMVKAAQSCYTLYNLLRSGTWSESNAAMLVFQTDEKIAELLSQLPSWFGPDEDQQAETKWSTADSTWIRTQRTRIYLMAYETRINIYSLLLSLKPGANGALSRAKSIYLASSRTTLHLSLNLTDEVAKSW